MPDATARGQQAIIPTVSFETLLAKSDRCIDKSSEVKKYKMHLATTNTIFGQFLSHQTTVRRCKMDTIFFEIFPKLSRQSPRSSKI